MIIIASLKGRVIPVVFIVELQEISAEVVLSNGSVVNANEAEIADLLWTLRRR
jgi:hypothetical protein